MSQIGYVDEEGCFGGLQWWIAAVSGRLLGSYPNRAILPIETPIGRARNLANGESRSKGLFYIAEPTREAYEVGSQ